MAYTYDADSRVTAMTWTLAGSQLGNLNYAYDAAGRVSEKYGSLAQNVMPQPVTGNTFNAANEMTQFGSQALAYDANDNLTADGTNTYTWDARNHLAAIAGGVGASFVYDALGRRAGKTISGTTTQFLYGQLNPVQELDGASPLNVTANVLTGLGIDEYFTRTDSGGAMSFPRDTLGSTIALTDSTGALNTQYSYKPFGGTTASGPANANPYQFTGRENDGTGLYYYRARFYSPTFQRFVSQDPMDFGAGDPNLYAYVRNAPTQLTDPTGQQAELICEYAPELCEEAGEGLSALINALAAAAAGAADIVCHSGNGPPNPPRCVLVAQVAGPGGTTCAYKCRGYGALATFPLPPGMSLVSALFQWVLPRAITLLICSELDSL